MPAEGKIHPLPFEASDPQVNLRFVLRDNLDPAAQSRKVRILQQRWVTTRYDQVEGKIVSCIVGTEWRDVPLVEG